MRMIVCTCTEYVCTEYTSDQNSDTEGVGVRNSIARFPHAKQLSATPHALRLNTKEVANLQLLRTALCILHRSPDVLSKTDW